MSLTLIMSLTQARALEKVEKEYRGHANQINDLARVALEYRQVHARAYICMYVCTHMCMHTYMCTSLSSTGSAAGWCALSTPRCRRTA